MTRASGAGSSGRPRRPGHTGAGAAKRPSRAATWIPPWRRGLPPRPKEDPVAPGRGEPAGIGSVLEGMLGASPWRAGLTLGELARRWDQVVGERLAQESAPARLDDAGVLVVRASTAPWAVQLRFLAAEVRSNANAALGREAISDVRIVLGPPTEGNTTDGPDEGSVGSGRW